MTLKGQHISFVNLSLSSYRPTLDSRSGPHVWECPLLFLAINPAICPSVPQSLGHTGPLAVQPSAKWRRHHVGLDLLQKRSHGHLIFTLYSKPYQKTCTTYNLHLDSKQCNSFHTAESSQRQLKKRSSHSISSVCCYDHLTKEDEALWVHSKRECFAAFGTAGGVNHMDITLMVLLFRISYLTCRQSTLSSNLPVDLTTSRFHLATATLGTN